MATATRAPTSDEAVSGTWTGTVGSRWSVVDDYPDTAGTDELTHGTTQAGNLTFGFDAFTVPAGATAITVLVDYYDYKNASQACNIAARLKVGGSYFASSTHNPGNGSGNRTQRTDTFANNPKTGSAWTVAEVNGTDGTNDLEAFGWVSTDANPSITLSSIQLRVTYTVEYAMNAEPGSFGISGQADSQLVQRLLALGSGAVSLSGVAATLAAGRVVVADDGAFTITGADAELTYTPVSGYTLVLDSGVYQLTGAAASALLGAVLSAASGSYSLTGALAALQPARLVVGAGGSYAIVGAAAELDYSSASGYTLTLDSGSYALTGAEAAWLLARVFVASPGTVVVSGSPANLLTARQLIGAAGAVALTGAPATLTYAAAGARHLILPATGGAYLVEGALALGMIRPVLRFESSALPPATGNLPPWRLLELPE